MAERNCVYKFIQRSQESFANGESLFSVLGKVDHYQKLVRRVYGYRNPLLHPSHRIGTSRLGLASLATYEYIRFKGVPLPDANDVIQNVGALRRYFTVILRDREPFGTQQEMIDF